LQTTSAGEAPAPVALGSKSGIGHLNKASSVWIRPDEGGLKKESTASFVVVSCGEDRTLRLWNVLEEKQMVVSKLHKGSVKGVSLGAVRMKTVDGIVGSAMLMATCSWDKSVLFYDFDNLLISKQSESCCTVS
jgi:WD40 repeat protein